MKKRVLLLACVLSLATSITSYAGEWRQNKTGWWYQREDGSYPTNEWFQDTDGKYYYFNASGYMLADTNTPDGYRVGSDGAWISDAVSNNDPLEGISIYGDCLFKPTQMIQKDGYIEVTGDVFDSCFNSVEYLKNLKYGDKVWLPWENAYGTVTRLYTVETGCVDVGIYNKTYMFDKDKSIVSSLDGDDIVLRELKKQVTFYINKNTEYVPWPYQEWNSLNVFLNMAVDENQNAWRPIVAAIKWNGNTITKLTDSMVNYAD